MAIHTFGGTINWPSRSLMCPESQQFQRQQQILLVPQTTPRQQQQTFTLMLLPLEKISPKIFLRGLTSKGSVLTEISDRLFTENEDSCKQIAPFIHKFLKNLHVRSLCVAVDDKIAMPNSIKDAYLKAIHSKTAGSWGTTGRPVHAWWYYVNRDIPAKAAKCNACVKMGKMWNLSYLFKNGNQLNQVKYQKQKKINQILSNLSKTRKIRKWI